MLKNLLANCFIREGTFKPEVLGKKTEIRIRELTIDEQLKFRELSSEKTLKDGMFYAVKCAMVDPVFFTDEELEKLNSTGFALIQEIFTELPVIGKTEEERKEHFDRLLELQNLKENEENEDKEEEVVHKKK